MLATQLIQHTREKDRTVRTMSEKKNKTRRRRTVKITGENNCLNNTVFFNLFSFGCFLFFALTNYLQFFPKWYNSKGVVTFDIWTSGHRCCPLCGWVRQREKRERRTHSSSLHTLGTLTFFIQYRQLLTDSLLIMSTHKPERISRLANLLLFYFFRGCFCFRMSFWHFPWLRTSNTIF